jgi:hypothetical protein
VYCFVGRGHGHSLQVQQHGFAHGKLALHFQVGQKLIFTLAVEAVVASVPIALQREE